MVKVRGFWTGDGFRQRPWHGVAGAVGLLLTLAAGAGRAWGADVSDAQKLYAKGEYADCIDLCVKAITTDNFGSEWFVMKTKAELAAGRYEDALKTFQRGNEIYDNLQLDMAGYEALRMNNRPKEAADVLTMIRLLAAETAWRYRDAKSQVALGQAMLAMGVDARQVLETVYDKAKKDDPTAPEPYVASGELALLKSDKAMAAESFQEAIKKGAEDADVYLGLAKAFDDDDDKSKAALTKALEINPHHVPTMLLGAERLIFGEEYKRAEELLQEALKVNGKDPRAWALKAVLANLTGDHAAEAMHRAQALSTWKNNPEVDYLIGQKLSMNYRFAEGEAYQRRALAMDPNYLPSRVRLCDDLLRVGKEEEGWKLADEVFKEDKYNVTSYNLVTLHDIIKKFKTLEDPHFLVRMDPKEANIYGEQVLALLERARAKLTAKYGVELHDPTTVEIFSAQKDFAIRTFGLPGGADYLGVCFGPVVTVNSPATRVAHPSNWEAIVWHEFCHTVTLTKTKNKMPRWISEGISVYEEMQENASWGQRMTPEYRDAILKGKTTPVSKLSSAFMAPPTPMALMFAYYESSQVVAYITEKYGVDAVKGVLEDLGNDVSINVALAKHTVPIEKLDTDFEAWFREKANKLAPLVNWEEVKLPAGADYQELAAWNKEHPNSFEGLMREGAKLLAERKWQEAKVPLKKVIELYPGYSEMDSAYVMLARAYEQLGEKKEEKEILEQFTTRNADAVDERLRLMEMAAAEKNWAEVKKQAELGMAIDPLIPAVQRYMAKASEETGARTQAIAAYRALLVLDPSESAEKHYHLGKLLMDEKDLKKARREVDLALEEAPRYREAHALLLELAGKMEGATTKPGALPEAPTLPAALPSPSRPGGGGGS